MMEEIERIIREMEETIKATEPTKENLTKIKRLLILTFVEIGLLSEEWGGERKI